MSGRPAQPCRSCGSQAVRVACFSPYRRFDVTERLRCVRCGEVFDQARASTRSGTAPARPLPLATR